jgi:hypothetical protein
MPQHMPVTSEILLSPIEGWSTTITISRQWQSANPPCPVAVENIRTALNALEAALRVVLSGLIHPSLVCFSRKATLIAAERAFVLLACVHTPLFSQHQHPKSKRPAPMQPDLHDEIGFRSSCGSAVVQPVYSRLH